MFWRCGHTNAFKHEMLRSPEHYVSVSLAAFILPSSGKFSVCQWCSKQASAWPHALPPLPCMTHGQVAAFRQIFSPWNVTGGLCSEGAQYLGETRLALYTGALQTWATSKGHRSCKCRTTSQVLLLPHPSMYLHQGQCLRAAVSRIFLLCKGLACSHPKQ